MARLRGRPAKWDRFAALAPGAAMLILGATLLLLLAAALTDRPSPGPASAAAAFGQPAASATNTAGSRDTDLQLYDRIAERVAAGESYYVAAVSEQRARNFPVRPALAVRLPTLAWVTAAIGQTGLAILATLLALATLAAWWRRLGEEPGGPQHRTIALLLLVIGGAMGLKGQYLVLHEVWAGMLLALAFALHWPGRWQAAWVAAALALAVREHALPFVLLMAALAAWRRDKREAAAWVALVILFAIGLAVHLAQVNALISGADRVSPSWLALRGLSGWTGNIVLSSSLHLLPGWIAAPLALLPLLGWAGWRSEAGLFGFLLLLGYGVLFMIAGRDNNFYWALVVTPVWFVGLAFVPRALKSLVRSAGEVRQRW